MSAKLATSCFYKENCYIIVSCLIYRGSLKGDEWKRLRNAQKKIVGYNFDGRKKRMTEKRCLKSKFSIMKVFGILFLLLMSTITVQAAANRWLKANERRQGTHKVGGSYGDDFLTPEYSSKVTISAKSSNPKVARVEANAYKYEKNYYAAIKLRRYLREQLKLR